MAKKKLTQKRLKELLMEAAPKYVSYLANERGRILDELGSGTLNYLPNLDGSNRTAAQVKANAILANDMASAQNEAGGPTPNAIKPNIDLYDGKEALKLVFEKKLDSFKWVNENTYIRGKSGRVRVEVRCGRAEFYVKPLFKDRVCLGQLRLREEVVDLIRMRAGTSKSTNRLLKLLHEL